jgi:catecholate siderophore receptor
VGTQRTRGAEFTLAGQIAPDWRIQAGYAHLDARITRSTPGTKANGVAIQGNRPSLTPLDSGSLWLDWAFAQGWSAGAGLYCSGNRFASTSNRVSLGACTVLDLAAHYRARSWEASLNVHNLADRNYIISGHGGSDLLLLPGSPRSADVTVRFKF